MEILGIGSALIALSAFIANEYGKLRAESFLYDALNMIGSMGLFYYAYEQGVVPFMLTNAVWGTVAGIDVVRYLWRKGGLKKVFK